MLKFLFLPQKCEDLRFPQKKKVANYSVITIIIKVVILVICKLVFKQNQRLQ